MKILLILLALALLGALGALFVVGWQTDETFVDSSFSGTFHFPVFEVQVVKPRLGRPLFGILPMEIENQLLGDDLDFDQASPGARVGRVAPDRLELSADGWELSVETDAEGKVSPDTYLVLTLQLAEQRQRLRCRPGDRAGDRAGNRTAGYLRTSARGSDEKGSDELDGRFLLKLATCRNLDTGKIINWPPAPLTVLGSFAGLPTG